LIGTMKKETQKKEKAKEIEDLRLRLAEAEEALGAIRRGEVDALVVSTPQGDRTFSLESADYPYRVFVEAMNEGAVTLDHEGTILYCNNRFAEMLEISADKVIGSSIFRFIPSKDRSGFELAFQGGKQRNTTVDISLKTEGRELLPVHLSFNTLRGQDMPIICLVVMDLTEQKRLEEVLHEHNVDLEKRVWERTAELVEVNGKLLDEISERKRMEEELRKSRDELEVRVQERTSDLAQSKEQLRFLASQVLSAQENERKRIALEIHDVLGSNLSAIKFKAEEALQFLPKDGLLNISKSLEALILLTQDTIGEVRRIQADLRPPLLDDLGILATLSWFCRRFETIYSGIKIEQSVILQEEEMPDNLKIVIFRIAQEAMNNVGKYAKADSVYLGLRKHDGAIELCIRDNGEGFDLEALSSRDSSKKGLGLSSMKERVEFSGGRFQITSSTGKGTVVCAAWHLE
jgi:PAS domain S-box-containing protein